MNLYISTTGIISPVIFNDLGAREFIHPTIDYDILTEYSIEELNYSKDFSDAIDLGYITLKDENGNTINNISPLSEKDVNSISIAYAIALG